jgi:hypothetical protein
MTKRSRGRAEGKVDLSVTAAPDEDFSGWRGLLLHLDSPAGRLAIQIHALYLLSSDHFNKTTGMTPRVAWFIVLPFL